MCEVLRDLIMLEPPKIFEVKKGVVRTTLKERQFVSESLVKIYKLCQNCFT